MTTKTISSTSANMSRRGGPLAAVVGHAHQHERIREVLAHVQQLSGQATLLSRHQRIRVNHWVRKLLDQPVSNPTWLKNVMEHATALLHMLLIGTVEEPFLKMPPHGPLSMLPRYRVACLPISSTQVSALLRRSSQLIARSVSTRTSVPMTRLIPDKSDEEDPEPAVERRHGEPVRTESKLIQTTAEDDQWEWQRVWKVAFERMRAELLERSAQVQTMAAEVKELRALVIAQQHTLEQHEKDVKDTKARHQAEIDNIQSVHTLEVDEIRKKHKKHIQEVTLQNEHLLRRRRREKDMGGPFNMQSDTYGDFLAYIDDFYADTLHFTNAQSA